MRDSLRAALAANLAPGTRVWVYGSLTQQGRFREWSDVDLAVEDPQDVLNEYKLTAKISSAIGREVDVCRMEATRLAPRIRRDGELWIV